MSDRTETAILAGGCFWPAQELLRHRDGVVSTRVGYTGQASGPANVVTEISEAEAEDQDYLQRYPHRSTFFRRPGPGAANREPAA
jgi:peptide methionine sulfoxide reductase MsrA